MPTPVVLFRSDNSQEQNDELAVASKYFPVVRYRSEVAAGALVVPRYSALPYFHELVFDLDRIGARPINSLREHSWVASFDYYQELREFTARTWLEHELPYADYDGAFVVKGRTNSRKHRWNKLMFAEDRREAVRIASELANDPLIGPQGLLYREYVPLVTYEIDSIYGLPFTNEWRLFYYRNQLLASGYYWSSASDETIARAELKSTGLELAQRVADIAADHANFFVLDIAERQDGGWMLIEVNDGMMSGLSEIPADALYSALSRALTD